MPNGQHDNMHFYLKNNHSTIAHRSNNNFNSQFFLPEHTKSIHDFLRLKVLNPYLDFSEYIQNNYYKIHRANKLLAVTFKVDEKVASLFKVISDML